MTVFGWLFVVGGIADAALIFYFGALCRPSAGSGEEN
jgi:hypothetical protein